MLLPTSYITFCKPEHYIVAQNIVVCFTCSLHLVHRFCFPHVSIRTSSQQAYADSPHCRSYQLIRNKDGPNVGQLHSLARQGCLFHLEQLCLINVADRQLHACVLPNPVKRPAEPGLEYILYSILGKRCRLLWVCG